MANSSFGIISIVKCDDNLPSSYRCLSDCSDFISLGNLNTGNGVFLGGTLENALTSINNSVSYPLSNLVSGNHSMSNDYLYGIMLTSTRRQGDGSGSYCGNGNYYIASGINFINVYFGGVGVGISFDRTSCYASGGRAFLKANHLIDLSQVTSIDVVGTDLPLYTLNTDICQGEGDCDCDDGVNVCEDMTLTNHCNVVVYGKDWDNNSISESFVLNFNNVTDVTITLTQPFASIDSISAYCDNNTFMGNGVISVQGMYKQYFESAYDLFEAFQDCASGNYLGCVINFFNTINESLPVSWRNVGTFTFDICNQYASFNPDLDFMAVSANIQTSGICSFINFLYPQLKFTLSSGFEGVYTCNDCCCESYVNTVSSGGNGSFVLIVDGKQEDGDDSTDYDDDCVCQLLDLIRSTLESKLQMINDSLQDIKNAILGLEITTTVEPCSPTIEVNASAPQITIEPCSPVVQVTNPVNNINVQSAVPDITVAPCQPTIQNVINEGDVNVDTDSLADKLDELFKKDDDTITDIVDEALHVTYQNDKGEVVTDNITEVIKNKEDTNVFECIVEPVNMAYEGYGKYVSKDMLDDNGN